MTAAAGSDIGTLFGGARDCACGRQHRVVTQGLYYGPLSGVAGKLPADIHKVLVLCDATTCRVAGEAVYQGLLDAGLEPVLCCLDRAELHADEWAVETTCQAAQGMEMILAVGAGTLGDIARYASFTLALPFATVATAASMDGFVSSVAPIIQGGFKRTVEAHAPLFVYADPAVLLDAPPALAAAGVGDMAGKYTSVMDWRLSAITEGEYFCEETADLTLRAAGRALDAAKPFAGGEPHAAIDLMDGLVLSGLAIQMVGNSRPASGSEHHLSHFWEMRDMQAGLPARLHGERVGVATLLMLRLYALFFEKRPKPIPGAGILDIAEARAAFGPLWPEVEKEQAGAAFVPPEEEYRRFLDHLPALQQQANQATARYDQTREAIALLSGPTTAEELGYGREDVRLALLWGCQVRQRVTLLRLLQRWGLLEAMVEELLA